jgi:hypothetical protein
MKSQGKQLNLDLKTKQEDPFSKHQKACVLALATSLDLAQLIRSVESTLHPDLVEVLYRSLSSNQKISDLLTPEEDQ